MTDTINMPREVVEQATIFLEQLDKAKHKWGMAEPGEHAKKLRSALSAAAELVKPKCGPECARICQQPSGYGDCRKLRSPAPAVPDAAKPEPNNF